MAIYYSYRFLLYIISDSYHVYFLNVTIDVEKNRNRILKGKLNNIYEMYTQ